MHTNSTLYARISPQWLSELWWLRLNVPWQVACELVSRQVPTVSLDKDVCVFSCNLPSALFAEWLGSFTGHCGNTRVEWTLNKRQHTKWTLLLPLLPGIKLATFQSWVQCSSEDEANHMNTTESAWNTKPHVYTWFIVWSTAKLS